MTIRIVIASLIVSLILAAIAHLIQLSALLAQSPAGQFPGYFAVAALSALVTAAWAARQKSAPASRRQPARAAPRARAKGAKETGMVKWFSPSKGFGFITRDNGEDIFVHFRSIMGSGHRVLREGQRVEFCVGEGSKGPQAEDVCAIK